MSDDDIDRIIENGREEIAREQDPVIKRLLMACLAEWQAEKKRRYEQGRTV